MDAHTLSRKAIETAKSIGFDEAGISRAEKLENDGHRVDQWLLNNHHAGMKYLEKNREKRYDPRLLFPGTKSIITTLFNYYPSKIQTKNTYKISNYALGVDYHFVVKDKLHLLAHELQKMVGAFKYRPFVDSAPVLDRAWAVRAGLGFIGKNTSLIHPAKGSYFFIGHLFTNLNLVPNQTKVSDYCGTCTRCLDACPTRALTAHQLDSNKCISYLTIENKSDVISEEFTGQMHDYIFGCDICQQVCPWNRFSKAHKEPLFEMKPQIDQWEKKDWDELKPDEFDKIFNDSALKRAGFNGLKRNINHIKKHYACTGDKKHTPGL